MSLEVGYLANRVVPGKDASQSLHSVSMRVASKEIRLRAQIYAVLDAALDKCRTEDEIHGVQDYIRAIEKEFHDYE